MLENQIKSIRSVLWPIYRHEIKKIIPMLIMIFLLSFNQCVLWNMKDSLVVTTSGAEVIPFIKVWAILPGAVLLTLAFTYLSNRYSQEKVFYLLIGAFLLLYALFAFVLYPYRDQLHPFESANYLEGILPAGLRGLISMYRHWSFTLFYVICELWNTIVISVLFWSFINRVTRLPEAERFYGVMSIAYNLAVIIAGVVAVVMIRNGGFQEFIPFSQNAWEQTMMLLMLLVIVSGLLTIWAYRWVHQNVFNDGNYADLQEIKCTEKKTKLSFVDSLQYVCRSKYLICIAVMVLGYSLSINLVEVVWKEQLRNLYPDILDYNNYISNLQIFQGLGAMIFSFGIAAMIKRLGWTKLALATPVFMTITCTLFFGLLFFQDSLPKFLMFEMSPLVFIVFFGAVQNTLSKAFKYSLFDSTKEMAFVPLSDEDKLKGKTAIDGVGVRLGKSGGSIIHQGLLILFVSIAASAPYVAAILLVVFILWILAVYRIRHCSVSISEN